MKICSKVRPPAGDDYHLPRMFVEDFAARLPPSPQLTLLENYS